MTKEPIKCCKALLHSMGSLVQLFGLYVYSLVIGLLAAIKSNTFDCSIYDLIHTKSTRRCLIDRQLIVASFDVDL